LSKVNTHYGNLEISHLVILSYFSRFKILLKKTKKTK